MGFGATIILHTQYRVLARPAIVPKDRLLGDGFGTSEAQARIRIHLDESFLRLRKPPSPYLARLFQYTSQKGLLGIIASGVVWATNVLYLSDSSELLYGFSKVREILIGLGALEKSKPVISLLKKAHGASRYVGAPSRQRPLCFLLL